MHTVSREKRIREDPTVPKLSPPSAVDFVRKSPKVAPNGRVRTKAIQNNITLFIRVKTKARIINPISPPMRMAPPEKPSPESSARKSPKDVPNVLENKTATQ